MTADNTICRPKFQLSHIHDFLQVLLEGEKFGQCRAKGQTCCVYCVLDASEEFTVDQLQSVLLSEHISNLLEANG